MYPRMMIERLTKNIDDNHESLKDWQILYIVHDKDTDEDCGAWEIAYEKCHGHLIARRKDGENFQILTLLNLLGIHYRKPLRKYSKAEKCPDGFERIDPTEQKRYQSIRYHRKAPKGARWKKDCPDDTKLIEKFRAMETCGDYCSYASYLLHRTRQSVYDGKYQYSRNELHSNLTKEETDSILGGYVSGLTGSSKVDIDTQIDIDEAAYNAGRDLLDWDDFFFNLSYSQRSLSKLKKTAFDHYERGTKERITEIKDIPRVCIFVSGPANCGKSYYSLHRPEPKFTVTQKSTGMFDDLKKTDKTLIIDDTFTPQLIHLSDQYPRSFYRRNEGMNFWLGDLLVVNSNYDFETYVHGCGVTELSQVRAIASRFYTVHIEYEHRVPKVVVDSRFSRYKDEEDKRLHDEVFERYIGELENSLIERAKNFEPSENTYEVVDPEEEMLKSFLYFPISGGYGDKTIHEKREEIYGRYYGGKNIKKLVKGELQEDGCYLATWTEDVWLGSEGGKKYCEEYLFPRVEICPMEYYQVMFGSNKIAKVKMKDLDRIRMSLGRLGWVFSGYKDTIDFGLQPIYRNPIYLSRRENFLSFEDWDDYVNDGVEPFSKYEMFGGKASKTPGDFNTEKWLNQQFDKFEKRIEDGSILN